MFACEEQKLAAAKESLKKALALQQKISQLENIAKIAGTSLNMNI